MVSWLVATVIHFLGAMTTCPSILSGNNAKSLENSVSSSSGLFWALSSPVEGNLARTC